MVVGDSFAANSVAFTPDGTGVFAHGGAGTVTLTDIASGKTRMTIGPPPGDGSGELDRFEVSPDGRLVAGSGGGQPLNVWDVASGEHVFTIEPAEGRDEYVREMAWSADSALLAISILDAERSRVEIVDRTGASMATIREERGWRSCR